MTTETIKIAKINKRDSNIHAWSNAFIGLTIEIIETNHTDYTGGFKVDFSKNEQLTVSPSWINGFISSDCVKIIG